MNNLGIILTLAAVCVMQTLSASTTGAGGLVTGATVANGGANAATTAPGINVNIKLTFNGTWDATYSDTTHSNFTNLAIAICAAVKSNANKVEACSVTSLSSGSIVANLALTAASTETSATVQTQIDTNKAGIGTALGTAGYSSVGSLISVADTTVTTTTAPSAATTLSTSVIMYLTLLCATAKAVL